MFIKCPPARKINREHLKTQRPVHRREFLPLELVVLICAIAGQNGDRRLLTFGPEVNRS